MPAKKKISTIKRTRRTEPVIESSTTPFLDSPEAFKSPLYEQPKKSRMVVGVIVVLLAFIVITIVRKGYVVAAIVGGKPIYTFQVVSLLMRQFGKQTLEGLITETIISQEARKSGVSVTSRDVKAKEDQMLASLGSNVSLDELLQYQGITKEDLDRQVHIQLLVEKLVGRDVKITDTDISNVIATQSALFEATDEATLRENVRAYLFEQYISKNARLWFSDLQSKVKVMKFLQ